MGVLVPNPAWHSTVKKLLPSSVNIALECATEGQRLAAMWVCKAYFCLLPAQFFTFTLVGLGLICLYNGYHAAVCFNNDSGANARLCGPLLRWWGGLKYRLGMALGDTGDRAFTQHNAIVLFEFVRSLGKGLVSAKVSDYAL